jgi:hypothetical protein
MTVAVIDDLEVVDIDEKDGSSLVWVSFHSIHDALQTSQKQGAVWKAGERIVGGVEKQLFLSMLSLCYISGVVDNAADVPVLNQVSNYTLEIEPPTICMSQPELNYRIRAIRDRSRPRAHDLPEVVRMYSVDHVRSHKTISMHR